MQCSRSCIVTINHKFHIRQYRGRRSCWEIQKSSQQAMRSDWTPSRTVEVVSVLMDWRY
jgi:hypothetical protein